MTERSDDLPVPGADATAVTPPGPPTSATPNPPAAQAPYGTAPGQNAQANPYWDGQRYLQWDGQRWLAWNGAAWVDASATSGVAAAVPPGPGQPQGPPTPTVGGGPAIPTAPYPQPAPTGPAQAAPGYAGPGYPPAGYAPGYAPPGAAAPGYVPPGYPPAGYAPGYQPPAGPAPYAVGPSGPRNGLGTAALVLGILAILFALTPITFWASFVLAPLAIILGFVGRSRVKSGDATNNGSAVAGIVMGILAVLACVFWFFAWIFFLNTAGNVIQEAGKALSGIGVKGGATPNQLGQPIQYDDGMAVTVGSPTSFTPSDTSVGARPGGTSFTMVVTVKNGTSSAYTPILFSIDASAGSPLRDCEPVFDSAKGVGSLNTSTSVPPGQEASATVGFSCASDAGSPLTVDVSPTVLKYQTVTQSGVVP